MADSAAQEPGEQLVERSMAGDVRLVSDLLSAGAPANYASVRGESAMTALMWASCNGNAAITKMLMEAGADPDMRNAQGATAVLYAFENLLSLNPGRPPPAGFPGTNRPAPPQVDMSRRMAGHSEVADILVSAGANLQVRNTYGESLVHLAAKKAQTEWVEKLVKGGVEIDAKTRVSRRTALHLAAKEGHAETVRVLVKNGAFVDARDVFSWTPLLWAAACGRVRVVEALLELGADPNAKGFVFVDARGQASPKGEKRETTPLNEGRKSGEPVEVSRLLIRNGAI